MPEDFFPGVESHFRGAHYAVLDAGAHVLAWTPAGQLPVLWVSPLARFEPGVAVRGGIPVVFPWFGAGREGNRTPAHGFARTASWRRERVTNELGSGGALEIRHALTADGFDTAPFVARLVSRFSESQLEVHLEVTNPGTADFTYEEALHTYLAVSDVANVSLDGLDGHAYLDKVATVPGTREVQAGPVRLAGETDRVYDHEGTVVVADPAWSRSIEVAKDGSANTVVWNPGATAGGGLADVRQNWPGFVCVEAANAGGAAIRLAPGETHILTQRVRLV